MAAQAADPSRAIRPALCPKSGDVAHSPSRAIRNVRRDAEDYVCRAVGLAAWMMAECRPAPASWVLMILTAVNPAAWSRPRYCAWVRVPPQPARCSGLGQLAGIDALVGSDVADAQPAAGPQHPEILREDARLVGGQVDDAVGADHDQAKQLVGLVLAAPGIKPAWLRRVADSTRLFLAAGTWATSRSNADLNTTAWPPALASSKPVPMRGALCRRP